MTNCEDDNSEPDHIINIYGESVDSLVTQGIDLVNKYGTKIKTRSGDCMQVYNVNYILEDPTNRVHNLRAPKSIRYLSREFLLYFNGTMDAKAFSYASKFWLKIQDAEGKINSNYGYYVFHAKTPSGKTQYEWVIDLLKNSNDTRRAIININNIDHKTDTLDMPCTIGLHFYIQNNSVHCSALARSIDVLTGLPYDIAFFSFILELVWKNLKELGMSDIKLGKCIIKTTFTQIYDSTSELANDVIASNQSEYTATSMPNIENSQTLLSDIYNNTRESTVMKWLYQNDQEL